MSIARAYRRRVRRKMALRTDKNELDTFTECHRRCSGGSVEIDVDCIARVVRFAFSWPAFAASI
jgi:hypothetical protein